MALASQGASALRAIRKRDTALFLDINGTLRLGRFMLWLVLLFLLLRLPAVIVIGLALLALPVIVGAFRRLLGTFLAHVGSFAVGSVGLIVAIVAGLEPIGRVAGLLLPTCLFLLGFQAAADVLCCGLLEGGTLAVLADYGFEEVIFARLAGREYGYDFAVEDGER
jgi:hypothetical protein